MLFHRFVFVSLCLLSLSADAVAEPQVFDPRSWKKTIAGPPTEVAVLGTMHLAQLPNKLEPAALGLVLDRLAAFKPTIITIEAMTGEGCDLVTRYAAVYPDVADQYCYATDEAEKATGLTVPAAEAEIARTLAAWPSEPTPAQRRHLAAVFLAANDRASAAVQWLRMADDERRAGDGIDAALLATLRKLEASANENIRLAAVLAARLGLERVYAVDDHTADAVTAGFGADAEKAIRELRSAPHSKLQQMLGQQKAALKTPADVLAYYRTINRPENLQDAIQRDFGAALKQRTPQLYGRQYVAWWETRNLRMVANIRAAFGPYPGARVLAIVGSSHKPYFDAYLDLMHEVKRIDVASILK